MLYGVDFRNFNNAIHGLLLYDSKDKAIEAFDILSAVEAGYVDDDEFVVKEQFDNAYAVIDEIDYRIITKKMKNVNFQVNRNGIVTTESADVEVVNIGKYIDLLGV